LLGELGPSQHVDDLDLACAVGHELAQMHDALLGTTRAWGVAGDVKAKHAASNAATPHAARDRKILGY
jgi:hypothetical protein